MSFDHSHQLVKILKNFWRISSTNQLRAILVLLLSVWSAHKYASILDKTYPIRDWLFWKIAALWSWDLLLSAACVSFGYLMLTRVLRVRALPLLETLVMSAATGMVAFGTAMYIGGFLGWYRTSFALFLPSAMILAGAKPLVQFLYSSWELHTPQEKRNRVATLCALTAGSYGLLCLLFVYLEAMTPDAINFDAAWTHLAISQDYARVGKIISFPADYARNTQHLTSIVQTWSWLVPGNSDPTRWMLALHTEFSLFVWTLAGVAAVARWLLNDSKTRCTWAAFFLFPILYVYDSNIGGAADHFLAFFAAPLFLATVRAITRNFRPGECALVGIMAAGGVLTKYQVVYLLSTITLIIFVQWIRVLFLSLHEAHKAKISNSLIVPSSPSEPHMRHLFWGPLMMLVMGGTFAAPQFLRNWLFYKNPVYPFMQSVFKASTPTNSVAPFLVEYLFKDFNWRPRGTLLQTLKEALELTYTFSYTPHYSFTKNVPVFGSLFTFFLPLLPFLRNAKRIWVGAFVGCGAVFVWAATFRVDRNLQGFTPILVAVTAAGLVRAWELGWVARLGLIPLVATQVIWGGDAIVYSGYTRLLSSIDLIRSGYEGKRTDRERFDYRREYHEIGQAVPKNGIILFHNGGLNLGIDREIWLDDPGLQGLIFYEPIKSPRALYDYYHSLGITHLLFTPGVRGSSTKQTEILFTALFKQYPEHTRRFGSYELIELPSQPPQPDHPYWVLSLNLQGYADGLYPIEKMKTYETLPAHLVHFPTPEIPVLSKGQEISSALWDKADAVLVGSTANLPQDVHIKLTNKFIDAITIQGSFHIYLKNTITN